MKGLFNSGNPMPRQPAMRFSYDVRPTFWQAVKTNSHLVIAAIGTAALLGVAAVALWLATPAGDRQAFANSEQALDGARETADAVGSEVTAAVSAATIRAPAPQAVPKADEVSPTTAAQEVEIPALPANDPRWSATGSKRALLPTPEQTARQAATAESGPPLPTAKPVVEANAFAAQPGIGKPDNSATAALAAIKPQEPAKKAANAESDEKQAAKSRKMGALASGRILRAVTMRAGPKKSAAVVISAIPAKASVQVVSCSQWCQIIYKGKRGWIYKSFVKRGG